MPAHRVAAQFRDYLDQVYAVGRAGTVQLDGQNIFVYRDADGAPGHLDVEFGVGVAAPFATQGGVDYGLTPGGEAATTTHWGNYGALGDGHAAVIDWCREHDVVLAGPRWEVYGHWKEGATPRTDIYYLISQRA
ncbi:MAG: GyrI-like domain-containing protein [Gemmatimonadota bacterium]|nr:GyrI-like domain-containing protein [Gemmatimonadota bacterium]